MATKADALDFADLTEGRSESGSVSSSTRGLFCGGGAPSGTAPKSIIDSITIASKGNATFFGNLTNTRGQLGGGVSDGIRGVVAGGYASPIHKKGIDIFTFASEGNATSFGDLSNGRLGHTGYSSSTRGIFGGGHPSVNIIEYVEINTLGNAVD